jgi:tripartite-type tricarboxylate transporter receptor subunit TctC
LNILSAALLAIAMLGAPTAAAQTYPERPITLSHGFGPGGNADVISRILATPMSEGLGQPVVVEARVGAGGTIAADRAAKGRPDGYTLIILPGGHAISAGMYKSLPYHPVDDFAMISMLTSFPFVMAVRKDHRFRTIGDVVAAAKAKPGTVTFGSAGVGSGQHLSGELLASMAGLQMTHVAYKGGTASLTDAMSGQIDFFIDTLTLVSPHLDAGAIRGLAVTSPKEWRTLPGMAPVAATVPGYEVFSWLGIATTKGTPEPVVQKLNAEVRRVLAIPAVRQRIEQMGNEITPTSSTEMRQFVSAEVQKWTKVIRDAKVEPQ